MELFNKLTILAFLLFAGTSSFAQDDQPVIVLKKQHENAFTFSGTIKDATTGKPLPGIRITYKNYSAAISDANGKFEIELPSSSVSVVLEAEGYQAKEVAVTGTNNKTILL